MNFLAHLHIADHCQSNLAGNLLGDFVKGDPSKRYSTNISNGIRLHRFVDSYTDHHSISKSSKGLFKDKIRRFAPIALDVFWDHCLANRWSLHSNQGLSDFCHHSHQTIINQQEEHWPDDFVIIHQKMAQQRWLESYQSMESIELVLQRMALRRPRLSPLGECFDDLVTHYHVLLANFDELYPDVLHQAELFSNQQCVQR